MDKPPTPIQKEQNQLKNPMKFNHFSTTHWGMKNKKRECVCQDASISGRIGKFAIAIVADGHGSPHCFRSHIGAQKAVEVALKQLKKHLKPPRAKRTINEKGVAIEFLSPPKNLEKLVGSPDKFSAFLKNLVKDVVDNWFFEVMEDEGNTPLKYDSEKLANITSAFKEIYTDGHPDYDIDYRCHAYGTTLIAVVMTEKFWFTFQVGDGKCVVLYEDGTWALPIPWDESCIFNVSSSICDDNSFGKFRYWFGWRKGKDGSCEEYGRGVDGQKKDTGNKVAKRPLAIFIGTDGVEDTYPRVDNNKYVENFYRNRVVTLAESGFETFEEEIKGFAERFAERESTDDVSIAGVVGDLSDKVELIDKMKNESVNHEITEELTARERDVAEKREALELFKKQTKLKSTDATNQIQCDMLKSLKKAEQEMEEFKERIKQNQK
jgi:serine/threonine protein phosphatase PrpC